MGFIGDLFGSSNGMGWQATGPSQGQMNTAWNNTQNALVQGQALNPMLYATAMGQGPNVAGTMLANQAGQIAQQQAGMQASQRGASANPALIARQAGYAGASARAQAAGQAAQLGQEQMLTGQSNLANYAQGQEQANNNELNSVYGLQQNANTTNEAIQNTTAQGQTGILGGLMNSIGLGGTAKAKGGLIRPLAAGGTAAPVVENKFASQQADGASKSSVSQFLAGQPPAYQGGYQMGQGMGNLGKAGFNGLSGLFASSPDTETGTAAADFLSAAPAVAMAAKGGKVFAGKVPGKAKLKGDSYSNDTVPMKLSSGGTDILSPGEIVLPRHVTQAKDAPEKAKRFVAALMAKGGYRGRI